MRTYIIKRLLLAIPTVIGAVTLVFFAIHLAPGDPAALFIPPDLPANQTARRIRPHPRPVRLRPAHPHL